MCNPALPRNAGDLALPLGFRSAPPESARKISSRKNPHNPLKSLDSDERIQRNPRQSKAHQRGSSRQNGEVPRKPKKQIDRTHEATSRGGRHPNAGRSKGGYFAASEA